MWDDDAFDEDVGGTVFRDVIMLALIGFVAMVIMLLPHLNPPGENNEDDHQAPGNVIVEMYWPDESTQDVDLWVLAPDDWPVGFWNQGGRVFNLLRDDLGAEGDASGRNYEVSYSRGIPAGEYRVNVHMYGEMPEGVTVPVKVVVSIKTEKDKSTRQLLTRDLVLRERNEELTAFRFKLTTEGELVPGSVTTVRRRMITAFE